MGGTGSGPPAPCGAMQKIQDRTAAAKDIKFTTIRWYMGYLKPGRMPPLALFLAGEGGDHAFRRVMDYVDPQLLRYGAVYLANNAKRGFEDWFHWTFVRKNGIALKKAKRWTELAYGGVYHQSDITRKLERGGILTLGRRSNADDLRFGIEPLDKNVQVPVVSNALDLGYGRGIGNVLLAVLSGGGIDGCKAMDEIYKRFAVQDDKGMLRVAIQSWDTAENPTGLEPTRDEARSMAAAHELELDVSVLEPEYIGRNAVNGFLESFQARYSE